jgi:hypothetical protein
LQTTTRRQRTGRRQSSLSRLLRLDTNTVNGLARSVEHTTGWLGCFAIATECRLESPGSEGCGSSIALAITMTSLWTQTRHFTCSAFRSPSRVIAGISFAREQIAVVASSTSPPELGAFAPAGTSAARCNISLSASHLCLATNTAQRRSPRRCSGKDLPKGARNSVIGNSRQSRPECAGKPTTDLTRRRGPRASGRR